MSAKDVNNAAFVYCVNMLKTLLKMDLITLKEYQKAFQLTADHYGIQEAI